MNKVPHWVWTCKSYIWIFNVGRGLSVFIRTALNQGILYDLGCNQDFSPTDFVLKNILPHLDKYKNSKMAQTIISHPHADHISEIKMLLSDDSNDSPFYSSLHTCPHDKKEGSEHPEALDWNRIKNPDGSEQNINIYKKLYATRSLPLQTICYESPRSVPNLEYGLFYIRPPVVNKIHPENDQNYGNGTSLVLYYKHGFHSVLIPGDITPDCLKSILDEGDGMEKRYTIFDRIKSAENQNWHNLTGDQPSLKTLLKDNGLSILVAPHHGLESSYSEDLYNTIKDGKPGLVLISDKRHISDTDGSIDNRYQSSDGAIGLNVDIEGEVQKRYSVSTRDIKHILISLEGSDRTPKVYLDADPYKLLDKIGV